MTAVALLTDVWVMVDHKLPTQLQRSPKLKTSHWFFDQCLLSKIYLKQAFLSIITQPQLTTI